MSNGIASSEGPYQPINRLLTPINRILFATAALSGAAVLRLLAFSPDIPLPLCMITEGASMSGTVLLIAGPSGSGKTTLTRALVNRVPFLTRAITVTTRLPRPGEVSGEDYHFVSPERFAELKRADALIECAETYTESYGIPRAVLAGMCDRALILTGGGALALRQRLPNCLSIFIQPASAAAAAERILERNCPNSEYRIAGYEQEVAASSQFDRVFLNADFDETLDQIEDFYLSARRQRSHSRPAHKFDTGEGKGPAMVPYSAWCARQGALTWGCKSPTHPARGSVS